MTKIVIGISLFIISYAILIVIDKKRVENKYRNIYLFLLSIVFYFYLEYKFLLLMILITIYTYIIGKYVKNNKKLILVDVLLNLCIFGIYKFSNIYVSFVNEFLSLNKISNLIMPIGLSFAVLKSISYVVDVHNNEINNQDYITVGLYVLFFSQVISGPISEPKKIINQFNNDTRVSGIKFSEGIQIFFIGLFKKIVLADNINVFVSEIYRAPNIYSSLSVLLCVIGYSIEIYCDFSGYSDMSIGISKMIGFDIDKNFNLPYISSSLTEFWSRWHISLSNWLKKYIYIPLGGNRKGTFKMFVNIIITMLISGLWHGSTVNFILWGLLQGVLLIIDKYILNKKRIPSFLSKTITFIIVSLTWIVFRSFDLNNMVNILIQLFSFENGIHFYSTWAIISIVLVFIASEYISRKNNNNHYYFLQDLTTIKGQVLFFVFVGLILGFAYTGFNPFIYGAF